MAPNTSKMNKYHPFWVRTHFGYFKPWFGAIILLFYHSFWRQGAPGGSRLPPAPKREIKQQNNGPKSWFKVPKVCPDPKGMVFTHFWGIWGHLDGLKQPYLVKTPICQKPSFWEKMILPLTQTTGCNFRNIRQFSIKANILGPYGKLSKNPIM